MAVCISFGDNQPRSIIAARSLIESPAKCWQRPVRPAPWILYYRRPAVAGCRTTWTGAYVNSASGRLCTASPSFPDFIQWTSPHHSDVIRCRCCCCCWWWWYLLDDVVLLTIDLFCYPPLRLALIRLMLEDAIHNRRCQRTTWNCI